MSVFNVNQNRQFYVANAYADGTTIEPVSEASAVGTIEVKTVGAGPEKEVFFSYKGADTVLKSDRLAVKNIAYAKAIDAADMVTPLKSVEVALDSNASSALVAGQDYVLRISFRQFYGMSDEDQYFKDAAVHCTSAMVSTPSLFWTAMVNALNLAFSREIGATKTSNPYLTFTAAAAKLTITEKPQEWSEGIQSQERVYFDVQPTTIFVGGQDVIWGAVTDVTPAKGSAVVGTNAIGNGTKIADLEWFCMGERGDQYRLQGWPNYIPTKYLVNPTTQYHVFEIHFAFTDTGVNSYNSEKDITIVVPIGTSGAGKTTMNAIISAFNTATGLSVGTLS
jgi:hypothetical protein